MTLKKTGLAALLLLGTAALVLPAHADDDSKKPGKPGTEQAAPDKPEASDTEPAKSGIFKPEQKESTGSVTIGGQVVNYRAVAGTIVVHPKGWDDAPKTDPDSKDKEPEAEANMFYVAYFKQGADPAQRPILFLYNGGPGSSTVWLHMGAFGPKRVLTLDDQHTPAAPYKLVNNDSSLLDVADLVFIDAPGTGFGRIAGAAKEKSFWGVDQDAHAFADFIETFLGKFGRWNSPKYLFGESYGTTRSANLINILETDRSVDFNGVVLLSQILNFDFSPDSPEGNPGVDQPYELALPTYAATAYYHHKLPQQPNDLQAFLKQVEDFAIGDYALALAQGAALPDDKRQAIAQKLHDFTGLPLKYLLKADLRISGGEFEKMLQDDTDTTTGRLDTRFSGPSMDPLSKEADYDPQSAAISSAYVSAFNDYVRRTLHYGQGQSYKPEIDVHQWDWRHDEPGDAGGDAGPVNVMPDLASAMKYNPKLKVMLNAGYYDLATPFFEGVYEMKHLPMERRLQKNISYAFYESGHMVYAHTAALTKLHDNVAAFIQGTDNLASK